MDTVLTAPAVDAGSDADRPASSGPFAPSIGVGDVEMTLPLMVVAEAAGADLLVRYAFCGHEDVVIPGGALIVGPALRRLIGRFAVMLAEADDAA